ncbi:MAG: sulfatase [Planctomycetota bacterium]
MPLRFLVFTLLLVATAGTCNASGSGEEARLSDTSKFNILMIGVEDLSANAVGAYGNPIVRTPRIDELAEASLRFDRAYCQAPVCQPSRASMVTGWRPDKTTVYNNPDELGAHVPPDTPFLAGVLGGREGVWTANIGKLIHHDFEASRLMSQFDQLELPELKDHNGEPVEYDALTVGYQPLMPRGRKKRGWRFSPDPEMESRLATLKRERDAVLKSGIENTWEIRRPFQSLEAEVVGDSGQYPEEQRDGRVTSVAGQMLEQFARDERQFFLHVGLYTPHTPLRAPAEFQDLYRWQDIPTTPAPEGNDVGVPDVAKRFGNNFDIFNQNTKTRENSQKAIAAYYACASYIDWCVGNLLDRLKECGLSESTIVVFYSDHGFHLGEHGMWSKYSLFEQSIRVPLMMHIPGGVTGENASCDRIVELVDLLPTLAELWDVPQPAGCEGLSFVPLLEEPGRPWKHAAFSVIPLGGLGRAVRTDRFKYAEYRRGKPSPEIGTPVAVELYDLEVDPWEQNNLAGSHEHAEVQAELAALLRAGWEAALPE